MKYFDVHGHLNFAVYDSDRDQVISRAQAAQVAMVNVGTRLETSRRAVELAHQFDDMYAVIGLHPIHSERTPHDTAESDENEAEIVEGRIVNLETYQQLARDSKVVAVGECGLDYFHLEPDSIRGQKAVFEAMIEMANEVNKPLMLHLRNGAIGSAYKDAGEILKKSAKVSGNLHFFAGTVEEAKIFLDLGCSFSFTGVITFARNYDEVIRYLPLDRIMSETDCPYVSPVPYRGQRNEPAYVTEVVKTIARIRGEDENVVTERILRNAQAFCGVGQ